jgi:hypothetical protein
MNFAETASLHRPTDHSEPADGTATSNPRNADRSQLSNLAPDSVERQPKETVH